MENSKLKIAFLVGNDSLSTRQSIEEVCRVNGVQPVGVLLDTEPVPLKRRQKNLLRNIKANGWSYPVHRIVMAARSMTTNAVRGAAVKSANVQSVLKQAFPERSFSLEDLGNRYDMPVYKVGSLNSTLAAAVLRESGADLGIVLGTRILKESTFAVPPMRCINLHKGKVPEYRGMPPGFWELYDGAPMAGVTVHSVDSGLDTGDVIATGEVPISKVSTPESLLELLHAEGNRVLVNAVEAIRDGKTERRPQQKWSGKPRSTPTRKDVALLRSRMPHWKASSGLGSIIRNCYVLAVYYSGVYSLVRLLHRMTPSRAVIFLHHRVNDYANDVLTVDCETFAAQLLALAERYRFSSTADIVTRIIDRKPIEPTALAIHFDDCYRDILTNGAPILKTLGIPACAFINSGFIGTTRRFAHDEEYPFAFQMLRVEDVQEWCRLGFEVGAHTVNHVDLGRHPLVENEPEIVRSGKDLEEIIGSQVNLFSYPFGRTTNITDQAMGIVRAAGYSALFSAYGGHVGTATDVFDIPREGANSQASPLYCLLQVEGLTPSQMANRVRRLLRWPAELFRSKSAVVETQA